MSTAERSLLIDADRIRAYSRRGNYHSDPDEARRIGLPGLLAQGVHVAGPAYGLLLDAWGEEFLAAGELDVKLVGPVWDGQTVDAAVTMEPSGEAAAVEVRNRDADALVVVGTARRAGGR